MPITRAIGVVAAFFFIHSPAFAQEGGWFNTELPVPVMHLEGTIEEVAKMHGTFVARQKNGRETIDYLSGVIGHKLKSNPRLANHPVLRALITRVYRTFIRNPMIDHVPERYRTAYAEFAKAAGVDEDKIWDALVLPDAALRTVSLMYKLEEGPLLEANFGCTSVIWNAGSTSVLHGRNLDYEGVGIWDRNQIIMHVIPPQNEGLAYVAVTALGVHAPGITAFNEAGLTLAIHQLTFNDTQSMGTPLAVISAEVIRNARTIDDAIAIIKGFPRAGGWAYVLSQGRDRAVVETSANEVAIRRSSEPFFFQTNHVSSPALARHQIFYSPGSWLDSFERADYLNRAVAAGATKGWATPEKVASLISNYGSPTRVAGGNTAKLDNIQSVVMDASHRRLWVAVGDNAHAPNEGTYIEYRWSDLRSPDAPEVTGAEVSMLPEDRLGPSSAKLRELLRQATNPPQETTRTRLLAEYARKTEEQSKDGIPPEGTWGGLYLSIWDELRNSAQTAETANRLLKRIDLALRDPYFTEKAGAGPTAIQRAAVQHRVLQARLTRGRLLDLLGRRSEALYEYAVVKRQSSFARVQKAAAKAMQSAFSWKQARSLAVDWAGIDVFNY